MVQKLLFVLAKIAENYKDEGYDVDRQGNTFEPQRKWDGDGYEEGCDPKEEAKLMENWGNCYSSGIVAEVNKLAYQDTSEGK
ncbi:hypothetical protein C1H46_015772 [Malus baccata]|uniref:Uncharacterized protein n=1 Tax=Malus baccata TaxID=106549 RepID=A0A540MIE8_MALBA|nr:hypothetical protein C1H46_015772 [Malus baccata]